MATVKAKLWNDNVHVFETTFKGDKVVIPPGKYIEGDIFEMNDLKGQYHPIVWEDDVAKIQDPRSYKKLRLEKLSDDPIVSLGHSCMKCKISLPSEKTLALHLQEAHGDADKLVLEEEDRAIQAKIAKDKAMQASVGKNARL